MSSSKAFSWSVRIAATSMFLAGMVGYTPPARSALFQASTAFPLVPNLVAYWPLDTASGGNTPDLSRVSPAADATLLAAASISTANKAAVPAGNLASLALAGSGGDLAAVPDSAKLSLTGSLTLAAWVRSTLGTGVHQQGIIEKWDWNGSAATNGYMMRLDASRNLSFAICTASGNIGISTAPRAVAQNTWTHVACTYNSIGNGMLTYVNGSQDATTGSASGPPTDGVTELHLGADYGGNQFAGNIDEARIYSKVLTPNEITILNTMVQPPATGFVATATGSQVNLSWTAASNSGTVPVVYTILRGTSSGVYTTAINNVTGTSTTDTPAASGTYYYTISAVSVIPSAYATEQTVTTTSAPPPPPPPPPAPRTTQVGKEDDPCGCGTTALLGLDGGIAGALALSAVLLFLTRRSR